jgi:nucleoside-diphosphate-sugar epimerase
MLKKQKEGQEIKLYPLKPQRDFVYVKDIVDANIFANEFYKNYSGDWYEVGSGESRTFEDVLDILKIKYSYFDEKDVPKGYQFNTKSNSIHWMNGWEPKWSLEVGLNDYVKFLTETE